MYNPPESKFKKENRNRKTENIILLSVKNHNQQEQHSIDQNLVIT